MAKVAPNCPKLVSRHGAEATYQLILKSIVSRFRRIRYKMSAGNLSGKDPPDKDNPDQEAMSVSITLSEHDEPQPRRPLWSRR